MRAVSPRGQAARLIAEVLQGKSLNTVLEPRLSEIPVGERPLCRELVYGTLRDWPRLQGVLSGLLQKPLRGKDDDVLALLAIGLYQLEQLRIPPHAAVAETVATTAVLGKPWAKGLVNAVLRNFQRRGDTLIAALPPAAACALPTWLFDRFGSDWPTQREAIALCSRQRPPMHLRVNHLRCGRQTLLAALAEAEISAAAHPWVDSAVMLEQPTDVGRIPGFSEGWVSVQDAAAQLAAGLLAPRPGESVLDACAAPGGKSGHLAEILPAGGQLVARDSSADRLQRVRENRDRLGLNFTIDCADASAVTSSAATFDAILADVPCSATGVLRRNPDVKVIRQPDDIPRFVDLQQRILAGLWGQVRPGGRLLYATCSLLAAENDDVIDWALEHLHGAGQQPLQHPMTTATRRGIQCLPSAREGDGLYYALLRKSL